MPCRPSVAAGLCCQLIIRDDGQVDHCMVHNNAWTMAQVALACSQAMHLLRPRHSCDKQVGSPEVVRFAVPWGASIDDGIRCSYRLGMHFGPLGAGHVAAPHSAAVASEQLDKLDLLGGNL